MSESPKGKHRPATVGIHGRGHARRPGDPVVPPIVQSATFHWASPADGELLYSRYGNNPNQLEVSQKIAALEGTEAAVALASGMGATAMTFLALAQAGDHIVASSYIYGATLALLRDEFPRRGIETTFVNPGEEGAFRRALRTNTKLIHIELPTNPSLRFFDPRPVAALAKEVGIPLTCDATFASPVNFRGIEVGIDVVIHSATKYLGGHSDLIAGAVAGKADLIEEVTRLSRLYGPSLDPNTAWLLDRGIRSLDARMARHNTNAMELAEWFTTRPEVQQTIYPGLPSHPDHRVAAELMSGFGGMISIVLAGGGEAADRFMAGLKIACAAPSLGGVETLISQPRFTSHLSLSNGERDALGIPDGFVRISVGIEDVGDLRADFEGALESL
ncbi:MAG: aminotransferase class I/II-fold pyridoxal phosphate-dependent enzyme [Gemmatimonadetes bacterium]|nr:aminotransferase class I/II-fold pyridoxal phosphate-dependent enzyme [Gemmatimonadota bacterium]